MRRMLRSKATVLGLLFLFVLGLLAFGLSLWQWRRAQSKLDFQQHLQQAQQTGVALALTEPNPEHWYQRVVIQGRLQPQTYAWLENQVEQGQVGARLFVGLVPQREQVSHAQVDVEKMVLVHWGWYPAQHRPDPRVELAVHSTAVGGLQSMEGLWWPGLRRNAWVQQPTQDGVHWLNLTPSLWGQAHGHPVYDGMLWRRAEAAYNRPQMIGLEPMQHYSYAGQWLLYGTLAWLVAGVWYVRTRK